MPPGFCYLPPHCLPVEELVWCDRFCVCLWGGGISESNTVNKQEWGEGEGEERNMEVLFITLVGE